MLNESTAASLAYGRRDCQLCSWGVIQIPDLKWLRFCCFRRYHMDET